MLRNYTIGFSNPSKPTITIQPMTIDTTTSLRLVGHQYPTVGEALWENLVRMTEHFAAPTPPSHPIQGQLWADTSATALALKIYNGTDWDVVGTGTGTGTGSSSYSLPTASTSTLGGVKIDGTTVSITNGVISVAGLANLSSEYYSNKAYITTRLTALTDADTALSQRIDNLIITGGGGIDEPMLNAAILIEATARIDADSALAQLITALTAEYNNNKSTVTNSITVLTTATTTQAQSITALTSRMGTAESTLTTEATTRATADSALAQQITSLTSSVNNKNATYDSAIITLTNADTALSQRIDNLVVSGGGGIDQSMLNAAVQVETTARVTADTALAQQITTLSATVNDVSASVVTEASARATADNVLSSQYTVKVTAGGAVAGFGLASSSVNGTPASSFIVSADKFAVVPPTYTGGLTNTPPVAYVPFGIDATGIYLNGQVRINAQPKSVKLTASAYSYNGTTATPATITITATLLGGLTGTATFTTTSGTLTGTGNTRTLSTTGLSQSGATVAVSVVDGSNTYTDQLAIVYTANGTSGSRGSLQLYISGTAWSDAAALAAVTSNTGSSTLVIGDTVTVGSTNFASTKYWSGTAWVDPGVIIDGNLLVSGTVSTAALAANSVTAAKIDSRGLSIKDASGNIILAAGSPLAAANITPAAGWLNSNVTIAGLDNTVVRSANPINSSNISTYIAAAAIDSAYISSVQVNKLTSGAATYATGNTFSLGSGTSFGGYSGSMQAKTTNTGQFAFLGATDTASNNGGWASIIGVNRSGGGIGVGGWHAANSTFNLFNGVGHIGLPMAGAKGYWLAGGTASVCEGELGTADNAGYFKNTQTAVDTEAFVCNTTTGNAGVFRRIGGTELNICTATHAAFATAGKGKIYAADGFTPFTGVHDGLMLTSEEVSVGDILVDTTVFAKFDVSNVVLVMTKSSQANQKGVIGVFVESFTTPPEDWDPTPRLLKKSKTITLSNGLLSSEEEIDTEYNPTGIDVPVDKHVVHVNALGEGQINVCGEGGSIDVGDLIVTSSIPGKGMKQSDDIIRSFTVAKSREAVTFESPSEVKMIACVYLCG